MDNQPFSYLNFFSSVGIFEELFSSCKYPWQALPKIETFIEKFNYHEAFKEYSEIGKNIFVGKNVTIEDTSRIQGAAIIGHNSTVGHAAFLRGGVLIGDNVNIGHATEVKHSIILSNSALAHLNYVGDSIVGNNCNVSGGATLANWRFDKKIVAVKNGDERLSTQMEKMGGILGDGCFIGVSAVLNPGTVLGKNSIVFPLVSVTGTHPEFSRIKK